MHPPMLPQLVEAIRPQHGGLVEGFELFKSATWPEHLETFVDCATAVSATLYAPSLNSNKL